MKAELQLNQNLKITIESTDEKSLIKNLAFWYSLPAACPLCGAGWVFDYREPKNYKYYILACKGEVRHESSLGQNLVGNTIWYKGEWAVSHRQPGEDMPVDINAEKAAMIEEVKLLAAKHNVSLGKIAMGVSKQVTDQIENVNHIQLATALKTLRER